MAAMPLAEPGRQQDIRKRGKEYMGIEGVLWTLSKIFAHQFALEARQNMTNEARGKMLLSP
jgi:hypothetical protein